MATPTLSRRRKPDPLPDLFPGVPEPHNPGGKVRIKLPPGTIGDAEFYGARDEYRLWLSRYWGESDAPYALWIGMNPSTADAAVNDPTVGREVTYTEVMLKLTRYMKVNMLDYRETDSKKLRQLGPLTRSDRNLQTIRRLAAEADRIILCYGKLHKSLQPYADETVDCLRRDGHQLWCLVKNADGSPKHPLYVKGDTALIPY